MSVPIVIGVTGHRDIRSEDIEQLRSVVRNELSKLRASYPHTEFIMLNSLASGADSLCAEEALAQGMRLVAALPLEIDEYRHDFSGAELDTFDSLLQKASETFVVSSIEPYKPGRDFHYRQAGIYVATRCHVLLALWDGTPGKPDGCGAAEAVSFSLDGAYEGAPPFEVEGDSAVIHITCPRQSRNQNIPISVRYLGEYSSFCEEVLERTESFNADCALLDGQQNPSESVIGSEALSAVHNAADRLSIRFQTRYLRTLWALSMFCVMLVVTFLIYDEAYVNIMLAAWAAIIVAYVVFYRIVLHGKYHQKYIQYRVLAEAARVQLQLSSLEITANVGSDFTWTQRQDVSWVRKALDALLVGNPPRVTSTPDEVKSIWIDDQSVYHKKAAVRDGNKLSRSNRITQVVIICTIAVYCAITVLEYGFPHIMETVMCGLELRAWGKIIWGCLSAVVVFVSGYYGRLSFERKAFDHAKMAALFDAAARRYTSSPENYKTIFRELAREEVIENGNWMSYCKEDRPTFSL